MTEAEEKPTFDLREEVDGYSVQVNWADGLAGPILRFPSKADALRWVAQDAEAWLERSAAVAKPAPLKFKRAQ